MANETANVSKRLRTEYRLVLEYAEVEVDDAGHAVNYDATKRAVVLVAATKGRAEQAFDYLLRQAQGA